MLKMIENGILDTYGWWPSIIVKFFVPFVIVDVFLIILLN
jgi:hypothetical protein